MKKRIIGAVVTASLLGNVVNVSANSGIENNKHYQEMVELFETTIEGMQERIDDLLTGLGIKEEKIEALENDVIDLNKEIIGLEETVEANEITIGYMENIIEDLEKEIEASRNRYKVKVTFDRPEWSTEDKELITAIINSYGNLFSEWTDEIIVYGVTSGLSFDVRSTDFNGLGYHTWRNTYQGVTNQFIKEAYANILYELGRGYSGLGIKMNGQTSTTTWVNPKEWTRK